MRRFDTPRGSLCEHGAPERRRLRYASRVSIQIEAWDGDLDIASRVLTEGFADYPVPQRETPEDIQEQIAIQYIEPRNSWIARDGSRAVGGIFAALRRDGRVRIHSMAVVPDARRNGVGGTLMARALASFHEVTSGNVHLEVMTRNVNAIRLYEAAGFVRRRTMRSVRHRFVEDHPHVGIIVDDHEGPANATSDAPLHRDAIALAHTPGVRTARLDSGTVRVTWRGNVILGVVTNGDAADLQRLLASLGDGMFKMIDVPIGDPLLLQLTQLGWETYAEQIEMVRGL